MESYPHVYDLLVISMAIFVGQTVRWFPGCHWHRKPRKKPGKAAPCSSLRSDKGSSKSWRSSDWDPEGNPGGQMPGRSTDHWWISPYFTIICNPARFFWGTLNEGLLSGMIPGWSDDPPSPGADGLLKSQPGHYSCSFGDHLKMFQEAIE